MAVAIPTLREIFKEEYYTDLEGGILEGLGRLFHGPVKLYVYPTIDPKSGKVLSIEDLQIAAELRHLFQYLVENNFVEMIRDYDVEGLRITPAEVLAKIQSGDDGWEALVPATAIELIKQNGFFGYQPSVTKS